MVVTGVIVGIVFWILGILIFVSDYLEIRRCTAEAEAVITDVIKEERWRPGKHIAGRRTAYYPVLEFPAGGKIRRVKTRLRAYLPDTYVKGKTLKIRYNPKNPADLRRSGNSLWESAAGMGLMFLLGAVFAYIGIRAGLR